MPTRSISFIHLGLLLLFVGACQPITREQALASKQATASQEELLYELVEQILAPRFSGMPGQEQPQIELFIGTLPLELPVELPLPDNTSVVGSVKHDRLAEGNASIYLKIPQSPEAILDFYREALQEQAYEERAEPSTGQVFVEGAVSQGLWMCNATDDTSVLIWPSATAGGISDVQIVVTPFESSPCNISSETRAEETLPNLILPPGVQVTSSSRGGSSNGDIYASADLVTDLPVATLFAALNEGLAAAGWRPVAQHQDEIAAWSTWTFTLEEKTRQGSLILVSDPANETSMFVLLRSSRE